MNNNPFIQRQMEIRQHMIGGFSGILVASDEVEKAEPVFDENLFEKAECYIDDLEKAHQDGDIHPKHPNWVWVSSAAGGKGDWRAMGGRAHKKHQETNGTSKKEEGGDEQKQGNEQPQAKTIADHASETKTETLEKVANSNAPEKLKEIAKKELKKREGHKDGDVHPKHSDWVWVSSAAGGKGDWRKAGGKTHQKHQASQQQTKQDDNDKKTQSSVNMPKVDKFMDALSVSSSKYSDINKVAVMKTPKGNWDTYYDGKRVGIINGSTLSDADAKKLGIVTTDDARAHSQRSTAKQDAGSQKKPKIDETTIDQSEYDKAYKTATSKEETEKHLKESLAKIDSNIKETKNALQDASDATAGKLQQMLTASISKKKAIEDALKAKTSGANSSNVDKIMQKIDKTKWYDGTQGGQTLSCGTMGGKKLGDAHFVREWVGDTGIKGASKGYAYRISVSVGNKALTDSSSIKSGQKVNDEGDVYYSTPEKAKAAAIALLKEYHSSNSSSDDVTEKPSNDKSEKKVAFTIKDVNKDLFKSGDAKEKLSEIDKLSNKQLLSISSSTIKKMMGEVGDKGNSETTWRFSMKERPGNDWNSLIRGVREYKGKMYVDIYFQYGNTDTDTSESFDKFFGSGSYRGSERGHGFTYSESDKAEVMKAFLKNYVNNSTDEAKAEKANKADVDRITNWKIMNPVHDAIYTENNLRYKDIGKYSSDSDIATVEGYHAGKKHLQEYVKKNIATLKGKGDEDLKKELTTEFRKFMSDFRKTFDAKEYRRTHTLW